MIAYPKRSLIFMCRNNQCQFSDADADMFGERKTRLSDALFISIVYDIYKISNSIYFLYNL